MAKVAIVVTVLNEERTIKQLLDSLINQTTKAEEIIIVDGGSIDKTVEFSKKYKVKVLKKIGNRSVGRNYGVASAKSPIIAFTDAGCIPHKNWLEELIKPFGNGAEVVSGYYEGKAENVFQKCLIPYALVMPDKIGKEFLPATRSMAIRKSVFLEVGGFNERLEHNEDYELAQRIKNRNIVFTKEAVVTWIPRQNLKQTAWMFLRFAIGDAQAGILRPKVKMLAIRYYVYFFLIFINKYFTALIIPYIIWSITKNFKYVKHLAALFWLPVLQITSDIMVLFGTIVGLLSRVR